MSSTSTTATVHLKPKPGFVVKSVTTSSGHYTYPESPNGLKKSSSNLLEPSTPSGRTLDIPKGVKLFINVAWDANVPPPPDAPEMAIRRAVMGEDFSDGLTPGVYYVPIIISDPKEDKDKGVLTFRHKLGICF